MKVSELDRVEISVDIVIHNVDDPDYAFDDELDWDEEDLKQEVINNLERDIGDKHVDITVVKLVPVPK